MDWFGAGATAQAIVPSRAVGPFMDLRRRLVDHDGDLLRSHVGESLDAELAPIFAELNERAPAMAAWAFRWRTAYALLRRGVAGALTSPDENPLDVWRGETATIVREKFAELVLRGDETAWRLDTARRHWVSQARATVDAVFAGHEQAGAAFVMGQATAKTLSTTAEETVPTPAPAPAPGVDATPLPTTAVPDEALVGALRLRAGRPLVSRAILRLPGGAADILAIGGVTGLAMGIAGTLSVDYLISRADALTSQDQWESDVRQALDAWRNTLRAEWLGEMDAYIDGQRRRAMASLQAEPLKDAPGSVRSGGDP
ncbi:MAG: hypothetical protein H7840_06380 [Alphaproteobacteria bacterium]